MLVGERRRAQIVRGEVEVSAVHVPDFARLSADLLEQILDLARIQVAQLHTQGHLARDDVVGTRLRLDPAHRANLSTWNAGDQLVEPAHKASCGQQGIVTLIHGRSAGVVGYTFHGHLAVQDSDDSFHYADLNVLLL